LGERLDRTQEVGGSSPPSSTRLRAALPVILIAVGCAALVQQTLGWNDHTHYAQVRAFDAGTPRIDGLAAKTGDIATFKGHVYSDKAPGLALATLPAYHVARAAGVRSDDTHEIHLLVVFGCVLPLALLLLLVSRFVEQAEPGAGPAVAVMLWLGSMLLPFSTIFFSHLLAAFLGFGAYYLLWRERRGGDRLLLLAAGASGGLAVATEYPAALLVAVLGLYVLQRRTDTLRRALTFGGGVLLGMVPLFAYNWWAFGSPLHISYSSVEANRVGLLGLVRPSPHAALDLLFGARGFLTLTPLMGGALAGIVLLYREGRRSEAQVAGAVALAYLAYNLSYYLPFGGWVPGPRFLIGVIPFLALPLATALRRLPTLTLALACASAAPMIAATLTTPVLSPAAPTSQWWHDLAHGDFGVTGGGFAVAWFAAFAALGVLAAARMTPRPSFGRAEAELAAVVIAGWILLASLGGTLLHARTVAKDGAVVGLVVAVAAAIWLWPRQRRRVAVS
jgi:hypothetical protein